MQEQPKVYKQEKVQEKLDIFLDDIKTVILSTASAIVSGLFGSINSPTPGVIISLIPPTSLPITGFPQARASIKTSPKLSEKDGNTSISAHGIIFSTSFLAPVK